MVVGRDAELGCTVDDQPPASYSHRTLTHHICVGVLALCHICVFIFLLIRLYNSSETSFHFFVVFENNFTKRHNFGTLLFN